ncbi:MAG: HlyD family secretion protein [Rhodocyclaceae bacterium]|jgi:membrane fusion protein, multidrug efflux system
MQQDATERPRRIGGLDKKVPSSQQAEPNWRPPRLAAPRRWLRRFLLLLGPLVVAIVGGYFYVTGGRYVSTENAYVKADKVMIATEVSGLIGEVSVRENQRVAMGDVLFRIDDRPYHIALAEAEARLAGLRDEIESLKGSYRQKQEELALARTNLAFAETEFERQSKLVVSAVISRSKHDAARHDFDVARQRIRVTEQELAQIQAQLAGDPDIPAERHPRFLAAKAAVDRAALDLKRTIVRAPFAGIASNTPQVGQQVIGNGPMSSPVMSLVAYTGLWIEANFKETDLAHVRPGQPVTIYVDTYPDREWQGIVESLSQATGAEFSVIPPQNATGNWVKVVQRIPVRIAVETSGRDPRLRSGMSTTVEIDTGHRRPVPSFVRTALSWIGVSHNVAAQAEPSR